MEAQKTHVFISYARSDAAGVAMIAHNGVNRDGPGNVPYIVHPHAIVSLLKEWGYTETDDPVTFAVVWGHDVLEDTNTPESVIRGVDDLLGERILAGIKMLTFKPGVPSGHPDYGRLKANYIATAALFMCHVRVVGCSI